jgi:hypothetical protein
VAAHDTQLAALALAHDGSKLATASQKGTIVRIFDCATALPLRELRRGSTSASLYCLSFNSMGNRICCSSDTSERVFCRVFEPNVGSILLVWFTLRRHDSHFFS